jgi:Cu/Ag efflux protein CusF
MKILKPICAAAALAFIGSAALAQDDAKTGMVTQIDRLNSTIAIQQAQDGTVGAGGGGPVKQYKVPGASLEALHAGDQVSFSATQTGGVDTITKIEKKKK